MKIIFLGVTSRVVSLLSTMINLSTNKQIARMILDYYILIGLFTLSVQSVAPTPMFSDLEANNGPPSTSLLERSASIPIDANALKSIILYNRLNNLVQTEPEMLDLLDLDRSYLSKIIEELLARNANSSTKKMPRSVKSTKRAGKNL